MAYTVWPQVPWLQYEHQDERPVALLENDGFRGQRTVDLVNLPARTYMLPETMTRAERLTFEAYLRARGFTRDAFLFQEPFVPGGSGDAVRTAVALEGVPDGAKKTFSLPTVATNEEYRYFPKQGSVVGKVGGVGQALDAVDTDGRTITFHVAPAALSVLTADYTGLRLVRLKDVPKFKGQDVDWVGYLAQLEEIIRE